MKALRNSRLFQGTMRHRRHVDGSLRFRHGLDLVLVDLEETDLLPRGFLRRYRRSDYLGEASRPLRACVLDRVEEELGHRPAGAIRMLTQLRSCGYLFHPVTFYLCHGPEGRLEAVVAEITNTPWMERFSYVLDARGKVPGATYRWTFAKAFHVSPFHAMDHQYTWSLQVRGDRLAVSMANHQDGRRMFDASLVGRLLPLTARALRRSAWRRPFQSQWLHLVIYVHALRLFLKRARFHPHPKKRPRTDGAPEHQTDHANVHPS